MTQTETGVLGKESAVDATGHLDAVGKGPW